MLFHPVQGIIALCVLLPACASTQLNYNTLDLASKTDDLVTQQVLHNFAVFLDNPAAVPAQVTVSSGNATTSNSVTPTLSAPLNNGVTTTRLFSAAPTTTVTEAIASRSLSVAASDSWNQSWSYSPVTDPMRMKRLQALYRYAVDWSSYSDGGARLVHSFPLIYKAVNYNEPLCLYGKDKDGKVLKLQLPVASPTTPDQDPKQTAKILLCASSTPQGLAASRTAATRSYSTQVPDEYYLTGPTCIVYTALVITWRLTRI